MSPGFPPREAVSRRPNPVVPGSFSFFAPESRRDGEDFSPARRWVRRSQNPRAPEVRHTSLSSERLKDSSGLPLTPPTSPQTPQSTAFISHLTNSNTCGNIRLKVRLTVSPFRFPFPPQSNLYSKAQYCLPTTHYPLFFTTPVFSSTCRLFVAPKKVNSFAIKQIQTLFRKHPGWGYPYGAPCVAFLFRISNSSIATRHFPCEQAEDDAEVSVWVWQPRYGKIPAQ
jgi:hypothetical protein